MQSAGIYGLYPDRRKPTREFCPDFKKVTRGGMDDKEATTLMRLDERASPHGSQAIYVHVPFCVSICTFCIFRPVIKDANNVGSYLKALHSEIEHYAGTAYGQTVSVGSVYFGGGTPSCLTAEELTGLLAALHRSFTLAKDVEVTIEASPSSMDEVKLAACHRAGANRLSFGVQTFSNRLGRILGLPQRTEEAVQAFLAARKAG